MKKLYLLATLVLLCVFGACVFADDTGTYKIIDYKVTLNPQIDGSFLLGCYQKWEVTSGHIPWITVGLPNSGFSIKNSGLNVKTIKSDNSSDWSGVRIDLDNDYKPGQTFEVSFEVSVKLLGQTKEGYRISYTPGWYDRAVTDRLTIVLDLTTLTSDTSGIKTNPQPTSTNASQLTWEKTGLTKGEHFAITIDLPKTIFPEVDQKNVHKGLSGVAWFFIIIGIIAGVIIIAFLIGAMDDGGYSGGGGIFVGGSGGGGGRSSGGGGGFGGGGFSCACACACACAGGGGAGCSRKADHTCPLCRDSRQKRNRINLFKRKRHE
ncbi:MAG: hypothetical protein WC242_00390 [Candidatus Paceibacterota bacterium]|jgi:hypothetical protein